MPWSTSSVNPRWAFDSKNGPFARFNPTIQRARELLGERSPKFSPSSSIRLASYLAVDYVKCLLAEFATNLGAKTNQSWSIPQRFRELLPEVPELVRFIDYVDSADELRNAVVKHDEDAPNGRLARRVVWGAIGFRRFLDGQLKIREKGNTPSLEIQAALAECESQLDRLRAEDDVGLAEEALMTYRLRLGSLRQLLRSSGSGDTASLAALLQLANAEVANIKGDQSRVKEYLEELLAQDRDAKDGS